MPAIPPRLWGSDCAILADLGMSRRFSFPEGRLVHPSFTSSLIAEIMPVLPRSTYSAPKFLFNGHLQTIFPSVLRTVRDVRYVRERISTPDDDFLDLDWSRVGSRRLAILSHGLEGSSSRTYMLGMVRALNRSGWDALAWNYRGCSGEINNSVIFYHSGATYDLDHLLRHVAGLNMYQEIVLIGFSLGGNLTLKYLGEQGSEFPAPVVAAAAFSVPSDLRSSAMRLAMPENRIYMQRFLRTLAEKVRAKMGAMPGRIPDYQPEKMRTFAEFDEYYTARLHGFEGAEDYWNRSSSRQFIEHIRIPTLLVNAKNDPFLAPECFPVEEAERSRYVVLEIPDSGGHVGFTSFYRDGIYWSEHRALEFLGAHSRL